MGGVVKPDEGRESENTAGQGARKEAPDPGTRYRSTSPAMRQYEDDRARIIMLQPHGAAWTTRLQGVWHLIQSHPLLASCLLPPV